MKYYHATLWDNYLSSINKEGLKIEKAIDRRIYLCKTPDDCKRFFEVRPYLWDKLYDFNLNERKWVSEFLAYYPKHGGQL